MEECTFHPIRDKSTGDYLLTHFENFKYITDFSIHEATEFSDHSPLFFALNMSNFQKGETMPCKMKHSDRIRWCDDDDLSFVYTRHRLCNMSQTIGLCFVAGRRTCDGGLQRR
jgi:hypothetical protein